MVFKNIPDDGNILKGYDKKEVYCVKTACY